MGAEWAKARPPWRGGSDGSMVRKYAQIARTRQQNYKKLAKNM
jgi:hypothetical protein